MRRCDVEEVIKTNVMSPFRRFFSGFFFIFDRDVDEFFSIGFHNVFKSNPCSLKVFLPHLNRNFITGLANISHERNQVKWRQRFHKRPDVLMTKRLFTLIHNFSHKNVLFLLLRWNGFSSVTCWFFTKMLSLWNHRGVKLFSFGWWDRKKQFPPLFCVRGSFLPFVFVCKDWSYTLIDLSVGSRNHLKISEHIFFSTIFGPSKEVKSAY